MSSQVEQDGKGLGGAIISLYEGSKVIKEVRSESNGDFSIDVPGGSEYLIEVSYQDCNKKKFLVSTRGVPAEVASDNYSPRYRIGGFTMKPPLYSIDYSALKNPVLKIVYFANSGKFDHEAVHTERMLTALGQIREAEKALIEKQNAAAKEGDAFLKKNDCVQAKNSLEKAIAILPQSPYQDYSKAQLSKCDACINAKLNEEKLAAEKETAAKLSAEKKAEEERLKSEQERIAREKAEAEKIAKAEQERIAKEKAEQDKAAAKKLEEERSVAEKKKAEEDKIAKAEQERLAREKSEQEKAAAKKLEEERTVAEKKKSETNKPRTKEVAGHLKPEKKVSEEKPRPSPPPTNKQEQESASNKKETFSPVETKTPEKRGVGSSKARHSIPGTLGADRYREIINLADDYLRMKRYPEAKEAYEQALHLRENDAYAKSRLEAIEKATGKASP